MTAGAATDEGSDPLEGFDRQDLDCGSLRDSAEQHVSVVEYSIFCHQTVRYDRAPFQAC